MSVEFLTWAGLRLGALPAARLHDSFELSALVLGQEVWEVAEQPYYAVDTADPNAANGWIYETALGFLTRAIKRCSVQLTPDLSINDISALNSILRTLVELSGDFQLSSAIVPIGLRDISNNEKFVEMVRVVETWIDEEDILRLIEEVPDSLLENIFEFARQASGANVDFPIDSDSALNLEAVRKIIALIPGESPVVDYFRNNGVMGYEFKQYASVFGGYISELVESSLAAANIALLWLYTQEPLEGYKTFTGAAIDTMFQDPNEAANVGRLVNRLLDGVK